MVEPFRLEALLTAQELINAGMRLAFVRGMTKLGTRTLRQRWKETHGERSSKGKLPDSVLSFIKNREAAAQLSAFAAFYKQTHGLEFTAESLMDAWREFQNICGPVDINAAYLSVRDIRARIVLLSRCQVCHATFIYDMGSRHTERCPFCRTRVLSS